MLLVEHVERRMPVTRSSTRRAAANPCPRLSVCPLTPLAPRTRSRCKSPVTAEPRKPKRAVRSKRLRTPATSTTPAGPVQSKESDLMQILSHISNHQAFTITPIELPTFSISFSEEEGLPPSEVWLFDPHWQKVRGFPFVFKRCSTNFPHLRERTKKRKVIHRVFRDEGIFSPRQPHVTVIQQKSSASEPKIRTIKPLPQRGLSKQEWVNKPVLEGRSSRLAPSEELWVGDGTAWIPEPNNKNKNNNQHWKHNWVVVAPNATTPPPAVDQNPATLKHQLMNVLRVRIQGESGRQSMENRLGYQKWAVWNMWVKKGAQGQATTCHTT